MPIRTAPSALRGRSGTPPRAAQSDRGGAVAALGLSGALANFATFATFATLATLAACSLPGVAPGGDIGPALRFHQPVVLLGEVHDNARQHALRLQALEAWLAQGARPALLMEQFDRSRQGEIDQARAALGQASADGAMAQAAAEVVAAGAPDRAGWDWRFYTPYVALALKHGLPIVAVNLSRTEARQVMRDGLAAQGFDADLPDGVLAGQAAAILRSHCGLVDLPTAQRMALAQVARDQAMARAVEQHATRGAVLLAGNGHVQRDLGVPRWLSPATRARSEAIGLLEAAADEDAATASGFDQVVRTTAQSRPDPCAGLQMRPAPAAGVQPGTRQRPP